MTTTINASTVSGLVNSADTSGILQLQTASTAALTIDASQNVGVQITPVTTSLGPSIQLGNQMTLTSFNGNSCYFDNNIYYNGSFKYTGNGYGASLRFTDANFVFSNAPSNSSGAGASATLTERMRIDSSGNLLVGTTATASYMDGRIIASATSVNPALTVKSFDATQFCSSMWVAATTGTNIFANFLTETTATIRGSITYNRAGGLVVYNTTSDYRAKTVNGSIENALAKVALLKPSTGRMNGATEDIDFFVAHELQEVVPSAVTGEKDAVNEDSTPKYQMVDKSALIPLLTKAIQELKAELDELKAKVNA